MTGLTILDVFIGLVFYYLLFSLFASILNEMFATIVSLRGKYLIKGIRQLLNDGDNKDQTFFDRFTNSAFYKQLVQKGKKAPSYMASTTFTRALLAALFDNKTTEIDQKSIKDKIQELPDGQVKDTLMFLWKESEENYEKFIKGVEEWYDSFQDRVSGWYKRESKKIILVIGLILVAVFNIDTIYLTKKLANDPKARQSIVKMAANLNEQMITDEYLRIEEEDSPLYQEKALEKIDSLKAQAQNLYVDNIAPAIDAVGLGWNEYNIMPKESTVWGKIGFIVLRAIGWILSILAISLGAPFWFDLLNKAINIRGSGKIPAAVKPQTTK